MINGGSLPGRLVPMLLGDRLGQLNFICPLSISCAGLVFVMLGLKSTAGIAIFGVAYGFVTGACKFFQLIVQARVDDSYLCLRRDIPAVSIDCNIRDGSVRPRVSHLIGPFEVHAHSF